MRPHGVIAIALVAVAVSMTADGTLTMVDEENVGGGPGDVVVVKPSPNRRGTHVVHMAFNAGEAVAHRLEPDGRLRPTNRSPVGPEPRAIALLHDGDVAVIVNSSENEIGVHRVGENGSFTEINRADSGGLNPYDVASYDDIVVVANRDSNGIQTFHVSRSGALVPVSGAATGVGPHIVSVSRRFDIAVGNLTSRTLNIFKGDTAGGTTLVTTVPLDLPPRAMAWRGRTIWVALDSPFPEDDIIRPYTLNPRGEVTQGTDTLAGPFVTDIEIRINSLYAATVNANGAGFADDRDELRVYQIGTDNSLQLDAALQTPGATPSFKQLVVGPNRLKQRTAFLTEFQAGWLRSFLYAAGESMEPDEPDWQ
jgi:hypothetical protein